MKTPIAMAALCAAACASMTAPPDAAGSLAAAESAFAAHSVREDMRCAFIAHFAEDGVFVRDGWTATRRGDPSAPAHGQFVSLWKRDGAGRWKVEADLGIGHPGDALWDEPLVAKTASAAGLPRGSIADAESTLAREALAGGERAAMRSHAASDLRFYRDGTAPLIGREAALASQSMGEQPVEYTVERWDTARSGDLGYARGRYADPRAPAVTRGYFLRAWRREARDWRVILDVVNSRPEA